MVGTGKVEIKINAEDNASSVLEKIGKKTEELSKRFEKAGKIMVGVGAAIIGGLTLAAKSAEEERVNVARLSATLDNVGVAYDNVKESLEAVIQVEARKTGIADDAQRNALSELILATGSYQQALDLLPLALDFAAAKQTDVSTAAEILGKVAMGNTAILTRYGITLGENATASDALAAIQDKVTGSAEKMVSPLDILKNSFNELAESVGAVLLPTFTKLIANATKIIDKFSIWLTTNPALIKDLLGFAVVLVGAGGLLWALSAISKAIIAVNTALAIMHGLTGPAGWATLAAGIAITAAAIVGINALMKNTGEPTTESNGMITTSEGISYNPKYIKGYALGGIIPGPIGQPVPIIAHGGEEYAGVGRSLGNNYTVNVNAGSVIAERDLVQTIREELFRISQRNVSTGIV